MPENIGRAPGDLAVLQLFVNTLDIEQATDELSDPEALQAWLERAGLSSKPVNSRTETADRAPDGRKQAARECDTPTVADLAEAIRLREALRTVLRSHVTHGPASARADAASDAAAMLREISGHLPTRLDVGDDGSIWPAAAGLGHASSAGPDHADRRRGNDARHLGTIEGLQCRRLSMGLLRPVSDPQRLLVHHADLRIPRQIPRIPQKNSDGPYSFSIGAYRRTRCLMP